MKHSVLLVDDHQLFRRGLRMLINTFEDFEVVDEATSGDEFLSKLGRSRPDLVMLDIAMPGMDGIEAAGLAMARYPGTKIITISMYRDLARCDKLKTTGVKAFIPKTADISEVRTAMETVLAGGSYFACRQAEP